MSQFQVSKSIVIAAPVRQVYDSVRNFRQWPAWSPWLITEPESRMDYSADGKSYSWEGKITGSGEMAIIGEDAPRSIDYQRGLMLLKDYIETGSVRSKLDFIGARSFPGCRYVGVKTCCPLAEISTHMQQDMKKLSGWLGQSGLQPAGKPFSICHKWDMVKGTTEYTLGFPLVIVPAELPSGVVSGEIPACEAYQIRHTGPYRYLGNAWAAGAMRDRMKIFAANKKIDPFEIYESDPAAVSEDELVTVLHFPIK